jgi:hypothetical protein
MTPASHVLRLWSAQHQCRAQGQESQTLPTYEETWRLQQTGYLTRVID